MDTARDVHTELLLKYGNVQTSPKQAALLNLEVPSKFVSETDNGLATAGYNVILTGYAEQIRLQEARTGGNYAMLDSLLKGLRAQPRSPVARILKGSVSTFSIENDAFRADYRIANGDVLVYNIQPVDRLQRQRDRMEQAALYRVKRSSQGDWKIAAKVKKVSTAHAAVNGQSNNLTKATWLMGAHLEYEFNNIQEYTLFHNPSVGGVGDTWESLRDKMGFTTPVTRAFAKVLEDTQDDGNTTQWVAHSQGGVIFAEGVRYLLNGNSSWALNKLSFNGARSRDKGTLLDKHSVVFHGNANNNLRTKPLLNRAGITVLAIRHNDYDIVPNLIGMNTMNPRKIIGSVVYSNHVLAGSLFQSPHTLAQSQKDWRRHMDAGPGKGRNGLQKTFHKVDRLLSRAKPNYLP